MVFCQGNAVTCCWQSQKMPNHPCPKPLLLGRALPTAWCNEIGSLTSLMRVTQVHSHDSVTTENPHCTRLYTVTTAWCRWFLTQTQTADHDLNDVSESDAISDGLDIKKRKEDDRYRCLPLHSTMQYAYSATASCTCAGRHGSLKYACSSWRLVAQGEALKIGEEEESFCDHVAGSGNSKPGHSATGKRLPDRRFPAKRDVHWSFLVTVVCLRFCAGHCEHRP